MHYWSLYHQTAVHYCCFSSGTTTRYWSFDSNLLFAELTSQSHCCLLYRHITMHLSYCDRQTTVHSSCFGHQTTVHCCYFLPSTTSHCCLRGLDKAACSNCFCRQTEAHSS